MLVDTATQTVLSLSITESFDHDITLVPKLLRRARVPRKRVACVLYGDKAYNNCCLHATLEGWECDSL